MVHGNWESVGLEDYDDESSEGELEEEELELARKELGDDAIRPEKIIMEKPERFFKKIEGPEVAQ